MITILWNMEGRDEVTKVRGIHEKKPKIMKARSSVGQCLANNFANIPVLGPT
jgi:hypothetical protein